MDLNGVVRGGTVLKVFSATKARDREHLGEKITEWLRINDYEGIEHVVRQSSDNEFHMLSITVVARRRAKRSRSS